MAKGSDAPAAAVGATTGAAKGDLAGAAAAGAGAAGAALAGVEDAASVAGANQSGNTYEQSVPTEIALENAQTYSITKSGGGTDQDYNLLVIPGSG